MLRVIMKDGRTFDGELFDRRYDAYKREGWLALDVDHLQHPEIPEVFLFEECDRVVDLAAPDVDLLPLWQMLAYPTSPVRMESVVAVGAPRERPPLVPPSSFPTRSSTTCPACGAQNSVTFTAEEEHFPYGAAPHTVDLATIVDKGLCAACAFEFTDYRAEIARDAAVQAHLRSLEEEHR